MREREEEEEEDDEIKRKLRFIKFQPNKIHSAYQ
jgi:hypothetical protein